MDAVACLCDSETGWAGVPSLPLRACPELVEGRPVRVGPRARTTRSTAEQTSQVRIERVLAIRSQLAKGSYSVADRLDAALDRILEDLLQQ